MCVFGLFWAQNRFPLKYAEKIPLPYHPLFLVKEHWQLSHQTEEITTLAQAVVGVPWLGCSLRPGWRDDGECYGVMVSAAERPVSLFFFKLKYS